MIKIIFSKTAISSFLSLITFSLLSTPIVKAAPGPLLTKHFSPSLAKEVLAKTPKDMTEGNIGYYELITNGLRALNREQAVRSFTLAKSRAENMNSSVSQEKKKQLSQEAENHLRNVDKINFAQNVEDAARDYELGASHWKKQGRTDLAEKFQKHADKIRKGEITSLYEKVR